MSEIGSDRIGEDRSEADQADDGRRGKRTVAAVGRGLTGVGGKGWATRRDPSSALSSPGSLVPRAGGGGGEGRDGRRTRD